ncbi:MAG: nucleotidyl transferase AbiEii/AbiGii toxin family protein [Chloroflexi bacterium]|nr:nucleotidyl transferase AbiEii/AbiGii toxin family protein [Chloroflexota bacterium]
MIEKRFVQWYASDSGVDLDIAEREIVLTFVLRMFFDAGILPHLAFKGGTAIRKIFLGNQGRFSMDLDFTMLSHITPEDFILDIVEILQKENLYGIAFSIRSEDYYANAESCGVIVTYQHSWFNNGKFSIQVSFRAKPLLPVNSMRLIPERYFAWLGFEPPLVPTLDIHEIIGEKIRATAQRSRIRDLYDLYQFASQRFDRNIVRRIAIMKCWETNFVFIPIQFLQNLPDKRYDWADLERLIKNGKSLTPKMIFENIQNNYRFLTEMTADEITLSSDPYLRERDAANRLAQSF